MSRPHVEEVYTVPRDVGGDIAEPLIIEERRPHFFGFFQSVRRKKDLGSFSDYERRVNSLFIPVSDSSVSFAPVKMNEDFRDFARHTIPFDIDLCASDFTLKGRGLGSSISSSFSPPSWMYCLIWLSVLRSQSSSLSGRNTNAPNTFVSSHFRTRSFRYPRKLE